MILMKLTHQHNHQQVPIVQKNFLTQRNLRKKNKTFYIFDPRYTSEELEQMACSSQQRNNLYAEQHHDMQCCICQHRVKDVQIAEKVCYKNPSTLPTKKFNEFDCITQSKAFANVCLNKDVLEAAIAASTFNHSQNI